MDTYHVAPSRRGWQFWKRDALRAIRRYHIKEDCVWFARRFLQVKGGTLVIHNKDGLVSARHSYKGER